MSDNKHIKPESNLFEDFDPVPTEQWEMYIRDELNSQSYKDRLNWVTEEGFDVFPFYRKESRDQLDSIDSRPGAPPYKRGSGRYQPWSPAEFINHKDPRRANQYVRLAIKNDIGRIHFACSIMPDDSSAGGKMTGIQIHTQEDFNHLMDGIDLTKTDFVFESGLASPSLAAMLFNLMESRNIFESHVSALFLFDPWAFAASEGFLLPENPIATGMQHLAEQSSGKQPALKFLAANGVFYHRCGATIVQELAIALATGSEYLATAENPSAAAGSFWMQLSTGSLFFPEVAKFRAVRMLWSRIAEIYHLDPEDAGDLHIHAVTSPYSKTAASGHNNILRLTTESMAAITGGADSLTILPFDLTWKPPDEFSSRLSRNIHHILKHESYLDKVSDPAGGSYYIEELTDIIAKKAWSLFQMIEEQGGIRKALENNFIQSEIKEAAIRRREALGRGKIKVTGVNHYPDFSEFHLKDTAPVSVFSLEKTDTKAPADFSDPSLILETLQEIYRDSGTVGDTTNLWGYGERQHIQSLEPSRLTLHFEKEHQVKSFKNERQEDRYGNEK